MGIMITLIFVLAAVVAIRSAAMAALQRAVARPVTEQVLDAPRAGLRASDPGAPAVADREERLERTHRVG